MPLDPLSAIGLAANIVQFIDFGCDLISDAKEIYHSAHGATANNVELQGVAESLSRLSSTLMRPLDSSQGAVSRTEEEIVKIAASSSAIGDELLATIQSLKIGEGSHRKWRSFRQALNTIWKRDKIAALQRRLEDARSNLSVHVLSYISVRQGQVLQSLEHARTQCLEIDSARLQRIEPMLESLRGLVQVGQDLTGQRLAHIDQRLCSSEQEASELRKEAAILKSLVFKTMTARYSAIAKAHENTFKWIFEPSRWPASDPRSRIRFHEWLTHGDGIYWVSGKPGSGKSTLMKYLRDCPETRHRLQVWADGDRLATASFFFWIAGTDMQKSQCGLLQQVLFEILKVFPDWIPIICPERWATSHQSRHHVHMEWSLSELNEAFSKLCLTTGATGNSSKLCIFIDGLDEYDGDPLDLIKTVRDIAQSDNVKVCVSSRPWNCFEDAFGQEVRRKLYLQDLTKDDIALYVREKLGEVPNFSLMRQALAQIERLISEIVSRAQGVFLWVYLVTRSLREGLMNGDSLTLLYERLLEMPSDLEEFFEKLIRSVDKVYQRRMAHTFRVALAAHSPLPLILYSCIDEDYHILTPSAARTDMGTSSDYKNILQTEEAMNRTLNGRYKGLLESAGGRGFKEVDFLHRTVRDFLATKPMQLLFASYSAFNFNAFVCICEAMIQQVQNFPDSPGLVNLDDFVLFARKAEEELRTPSTSLMDRMNKVFYSSTPMFRDSLEIYDEHAVSLLGKAIERHYLSYLRDRLKRQPDLFSGLDARVLKMPFMWEYYYRNSAGGRGTWGSLPEQASCEMAVLLLENGADPNGMIDGKPILHALLDGYGIHEGEEPEAPAYNGYFPLLTLLLKYGAKFHRDFASDSCAFWRSPRGHSWPTEFPGFVQELYCLLFARGLNPNIKIDFPQGKRTLWGHLLHEVYSVNPRIDEVCLRLMILFVEHGADPSLTQEYPGYGTLPVSELAEQLFLYLSPDEHLNFLHMRFKALLEDAMWKETRPPAQHWRPERKRDHRRMDGQDAWQTDEEVRKHRRLQDGRQRPRGAHTGRRRSPRRFKYKRQRREEGGQRDGYTRRNERR